ncbi:unnamed protein product [Amoebophrya sp. A25]|nr:unnamed protein product [Amoebophrya sp. A25]|eukprot:GSA25T00022043001.1
MSDEEWEETVESRYRQLLNVIQDPQELASELRLAPWAWGAWAFSKLAEKAALGNEVARPPIVWLRGYIAGGGGEPFKPPKWRIVVAQKRFETNLGEWVGEARRRPDRGDQVVNAMKSAAESVRNYHEMGKAHRMIHPENMLAHIVDENTRIAEFVLGNLMGIVEQAENRFGPLQGETTGPKCEDEDAMRRRWFDAIRGKKFWATVGRTYTYACKNYYSAYPSAVDFYFAMSGARNEEAGPLEYIDPAAVTRFNDPRVDTTRPKLSYVTYQQSDVWSVGVMILKMLKQFLTGGKYDKDAAKTIEAVDKALADELRASKVSVSEDVQESGGTTENDKEKQMLKEQMLKEWAKKSKCVTRWGDYGRNLRDRRHHSLLDDKLSAALGSTSQKSRGFFSGWKAEKASSEKGKALATFLRDGLLRYSLTCNQHSRDLTKLIDALETLAKAWGKADSDNQPRATAPAFLERSATAFDSEVVSAPAAPAPIDTEGAAAHPSPRFRASRARDFAFGAEEAAVSTGTTTSEQLTGRRDFLSAQHSQESTVHADEEALAVKAITNCC